ncbi:hypothetical protein [Persephonella sp. KM09-Lau-8]|uniref:hypothetical protein n=1 Tax=Persephonella sp. KM09-Lau-8 TaxID=1158345 RepID=UPI0004970B46|nr:hypothetical protein [Persephonella sp. KM09-Lau-8]
MVIKGIDLGLQVWLFGEVNPLKKEVKLLKKEPKNFKNIYAFPASKSTFRKYTFPFKDKNKIEKAVRTQIQLDIPVEPDQLEYGYYVHHNKGKSEVFCVIVRKEDLSSIKDAEIIDSEIFSLLRVARYYGIKSCKIIHFSEDYILYLQIEDDFIQQARVLSSVPEIDNETYLSGKIPEDLKNTRILKNPEENPVLNVAFGAVLRGIDDTGVDFLHKAESKNTERLIKGAIYLFTAVVLINIALFVKLFLLEKQLKTVKEKEKEIFMKGFNYTGEIFDPLEQAKGKLKAIKEGSSISTDAVDVLSFIAKEKKSFPDIKIYRINITESRFILQGTAHDIKSVENFKNRLSQKYPASIDETVSTPDGKIRFSISGEVK